MWEWSERISFRMSSVYLIWCRTFTPAPEHCTTPNFIHPSISVWKLFSHETVTHLPCVAVYENFRIRIIIHMDSHHCNQLIYVWQSGCLTENFHFFYVNQPVALGMSSTYAFIINQKIIFLFPSWKDWCFVLFFQLEFFQQSVWCLKRKKKSTKNLPS